MNVIRSSSFSHHKLLVLKWRTLGLFILRIYYAPTFSSLVQSVNFWAHSELLRIVSIRIQYRHFNCRCAMHLSRPTCGAERSKYNVNFLVLKHFQRFKRTVLGVTSNLSVYDAWPFNISHNHHHHHHLSSSSAGQQREKFRQNLNVYINPFTADPVKALHFAILV